MITLLPPLLCRLMLVWSPLTQQSVIRREGNDRDKYRVPLMLFLASDLMTGVGGIVATVRHLKPLPHRSSAGEAWYQYCPVCHIQTSARTIGGAL